MVYDAVEARLDGAFSNLLQARNKETRTKMERVPFCLAGGEGLARLRVVTVLLKCGPRACHG